MADTLPEAYLKWNEAWTSTAIKFAVITVVFIVALTLMFTLGSLQEVGKNFPRYRCNPIVMPFAGSFGYDPAENFNYCIGNVLRARAVEYFSPIYNLLAGFTAIIQQIVDVTLGIRKLFSNFLFGVNSFIRNVRDRIQGLLSQIRLSFMRMNFLMGRVFGTMYAVIWMGTSAITAGMGIPENGMVKFLMEFCFDPETPIQMLDGTWRAIKDVAVHDQLAPVDGISPQVTSTFRFNGLKTPMVRIGDVTVSSEHYVKYANRWIPAGQHPEARIAERCPELVCLNVSGHAFYIGRSNLIAADYDEHETLSVVAETQQTALKAMNGRAAPELPTISNYSLGMAGDIRVHMMDGSWRPLRDIVVGDGVWNGGIVHGVVQEHTPAVVHLGTLTVAPAQAVHAEGAWKRAGHLKTAVTTAAPQTLYSLITESGSALEVQDAAGTKWFVRDYREVAVPEMESAYAAEFEDLNAELVC